MPCDSSSAARETNKHGLRAALRTLGSHRIALSEWPLFLCFRIRRNDAAPARLEPGNSRVAAQGDSGLLCLTLHLYVADPTLPAVRKQLFWLNDAAHVRARSTHGYISGPQPLYHVRHTLNVWIL